MRITEAIEAVYAYRGMNVKVIVHEKKDSAIESRAHTQGQMNDLRGLYHKEIENGTEKRKKFH